MRIRGKKYKAKVKLVDKAKRYMVDEAMELVKNTAIAKFDESVELAIKLGVDSKKNMIRGTVVLPAGSGKSKKVAVLTKQERVKEAQDAGASVAGADDLVEKIKGGFLGFDVLIATPDMMPQIGKLGKILGTKGLMPNPKSGTVTNDLAKTVKEFMSGKVEFRMDKTAVLHMVLGKVSFDKDALTKNFYAALSEIRKQKPSGLKGNYIESIAVSSSMGPGIRLDARAITDKMEKEH